MITRNGYKIKITPETNFIKKDLIVRPIVLNKFAKGPPKVIKCYKQSPNSYYVPRYYGFQKFGELIHPFDHVSIQTTFNGSLRDYQTEVVNKSVDAMNDPCTRGGILAMGTGSGKTVCALKIFQTMGVKTLIVVHKEFLLHQWIDQIKIFLPDVSIGIVQSTKIETNNDIVIGLAQSISQREYPEGTFDDFGLLCVDECHHINSEVFSKVLFKVQPLYRLGLSATPKRKDGLDKILEYHIGPIIHKLEMTIIDPEINVIHMNTFLTPEALPIMLTKITKLTWRNIRIMDIIKNNRSRKILIFSDRVDHCKCLHEMCNTLEIKSAVFIGGLTKQERAIAMDHDILFCTFSMAKEGFDLPKLDTIIFATPKCDIVQCVGRILRRKNENSPIVYDIVDTCFKYMWYQRTKFYKSRNYIVNILEN